MICTSVPFVFSTVPWDLVCSTLWFTLLYLVICSTVPDDLLYCTFWSATLYRVICSSVPYDLPSFTVGTLWSGLLYLTIFSTVPSDLPFFLYLVFVKQVPKGHYVGEALVACLEGQGRGEEKRHQQPVHAEFALSEGFRWPQGSLHRLLYLNAALSWRENKHWWGISYHICVCIICALRDLFAAKLNYMQTCFLWIFKFTIVFKSL